MKNKKYREKLKVYKILIFFITKDLRVCTSICQQLLSNNLKSHNQKKSGDRIKYHIIITC